MKIPKIEALCEYDVFGWEEQFGTDTLCPVGHEFEGLPYWVEYMPHHLQLEYLGLVSKDEFIDTSS